MMPDIVLPSGKKLRGEMVQDSWWQKQSCCSHLCFIRKNKGQPQQCPTEETGQSAVVGKSNPEEEEPRENVAPLAFFCRYGQVGENASAVLLSVLNAIGLTVKEKLGGERECGTESGNERERERMGGP